MELVKQAGGLVVSFASQLIAIFSIANRGAAAGRDLRLGCGSWLAGRSLGRANLAIVDMAFHDGPTTVLSGLISPPDGEHILSVNQSDTFLTW
jgi:hypothetical protein